MKYFVLILLLACNSKDKFNSGKYISKEQELRNRIQALDDSIKFYETLDRDTLPIDVRSNMNVKQYHFRKQKALVVGDLQNIWKQRAADSVFQTK